MATERYTKHEWLIIAKFPSYEDAKAFQALAEEAFAPLEMIARPKGQYESAGNVANWRMTHALRALLSGNSFDKERLAIAAESARFSAKSAQSWLTKALRFEVIRRLEVGTYEFLPLPACFGSPQAGELPISHSAAELLPSEEPL